MQSGPDTETDRSLDGGTDRSLVDASNAGQNQAQRGHERRSSEARESGGLRQSATKSEVKERRLPIIPSSLLHW